MKFMTTLIKPFRTPQLQIPAEGNDPALHAAAPSYRKILEISAPLKLKMNFTPVKQL